MQSTLLKRPPDMRHWHPCRVHSSVLPRPPDMRHWHSCSMQYFCAFMATTSHGRLYMNSTASGLLIVSLYFPSQTLLPQYCANLTIENTPNAKNFKFLILHNMYIFCKDFFVMYEPSIGLATEGTVLNKVNSDVSYFPFKP